MNKTQLVSSSMITLLLSMTLSQSVFAYGGGARQVVCKKPEVKVLSPQPQKGALAVAPGSEFVFEVSSDAKQKAISMSAKDIDIPAQISTMNNGKLKVSGNLPEALVDGYASVALTAPSESGKCNGQAKILVQIQ
ncbi:MAG: hypothetical protein K0U68_15650 [Gammaproteobacteria bacterium]|nr:hypothetical protein [Gammaproteobacteria bacterium]